MLDDRTIRPPLYSLPSPSGNANYPALNIRRPTLRTEYDPVRRTVWVYLNPKPRPCFSPQLLSDILAMQDAVARAHDAVDFMVVASEVPGVFNLGGDLNLFREVALAKDAETLLHYAESCVKCIHSMLTGLGSGVITIAVLQGDALGGGLEAALACQYVIAEKGVKMGFPEIMFNLFPGMGAFSMIARKVSPRVADELITSGRTVSAEEMHQLGVVDFLAGQGMGEWLAQKVIADKAHSLNGLRAHLRSKRHTPFAVTYEELMAVTREWVNAACTLEARDLKLMDRLVKAQDRLVTSHARRIPATTAARDLGTALSA